MKQTCRTGRISKTKICDTKKMVSLPNTPVDRQFDADFESQLLNHGQTVAVMKFQSFTAVDSSCMLPILQKAPFERIEK